MAGKVQPHHMWDGTYTLDDWCDVHEMLDLEQELTRRERAKVKSSGNK